MFTLSQSAKVYVPTPSTYATVLMWMAVNPSIEKFVQININWVIEREDEREWEATIKKYPAIKRVSNEFFFQHHKLNQKYNYYGMVS